MVLAQRLSPHSAAQAPLHAQVITAFKRPAESAQTGFGWGSANASPQRAHEVPPSGIADDVDVTEKLLAPPKPAVSLPLLAPPAPAHSDAFDASLWVPA